MKSVSLSWMVKWNYSLLIVLRILLICSPRTYHIRNSEFRASMPIVGHSWGGDHVVNAGAGCHCHPGGGNGNGWCAVVAIIAVNANDGSSDGHESANQWWVMGKGVVGVGRGCHLQTHKPSAVTHTYLPCSYEDAPCIDDDNDKTHPPWPPLC